MDIADQFKKIGILFADDGFISVLEEMAASFVAFIEGHGVTGHKTSHHLAERGRAGAQKKVKMVRDQSPGVALGLGFLENGGEPLQERLPILIVEKDLSSFDAPGHDMLEKAGGV